MKKLSTIARIVLCLSVFIPFINNIYAQSNPKDSIRILITKYDNNSSLAGVVTFSAVMEKDSATAPVYIIGDSTTHFISELRVDAIEKISYVSGKAVPKKMKAKTPNGFVLVELKKDETFQMSQVLPPSKVVQRQAFVTRLPLSALNNSSGQFSALANELVTSYGTDDQVFRAQQEDNLNQTPILALDSLNHRALVESLSDFKNGTIETIDAYDAVNAMKIIGDKGVNGLLVVVIKSSYTLKQALISPMDKIKKQAQDLDRVNYTTLVIRNPIIIK